MEKPRVVLFGSIGLAKKCLEDIIIRENVELLGACCVPMENTWRENEEGVYEYCKKRGIPILNMNEIKEMKPDIGFSIRFNKIIPKDIINSFSVGIFNTHGGVLPRYRGVYSNIHALINGEKEYGVTLHYVTPGIDNGDIVEVKKIPILTDDTGYTLYRKGETLCFDILKENLESIISGTNNRVTQDELIKKGASEGIYSKKDTKQLKEIDANKINDFKSLNIIRAFDSPFHEPAYTFIGDKKIYLRMESF